MNKIMDEIEYLKWIYQRCQEGYHSRDQMTHEFVHKIINILSFLVAFLSIPLIIKSKMEYKTGIPWYGLYVFIIGMIGFVFLLYFIFMLNSMVNCKIALRRQSESIEKKFDSCISHI